MTVMSLMKFQSINANVDNKGYNKYSFDILKEKNVNIQNIRKILIEMTMTRPCKILHNIMIL